MSDNYVIFADDDDHIKVMYHDVLKQGNVVFLGDYLQNESKIAEFLFMVHYSSKINNAIKLPFKKIWFSKHFQYTFNNNSRMVFVFLHQWHRIIQNGYIEYLREQYPGCICILYLQDINGAKRFDIDEEKKRFDKILVFEKNFAREHEIEYYPLVYSEVLQDEGYSPRTSDIIFIGRSKGRLPLIDSICKRLSHNNVNFDFYLSDVEPSHSSYNGAIHIIKPMSNYENVRTVKKSKCILDIVPPNTDCNTLRVSEAIAYGVKILTNNIHITEEPFYNPKYISVYTTADDIDVDFLKEEYEPVDYKYKDKISPIQLLKYISD